MDLLQPEDKRKVPDVLQKILRNDIKLTKKFVENSQRITALRSLANHAKFLEVSCHGIVWLAGWLTFIWLFNNSEMYQIQVNMLIALFLDIVVIAVIKAFVRRRRPVPMNKLIPGNPDKYSFPSGHASRATLVAVILIYIEPISIIFYPPLIAWVTSVSISRILLERHYILDVLGGIGIGLIEALFMSMIWLSQSGSAYILNILSDEKRDGGEFHV
ncbi:polyisoprenoid diphosphate/phosphate phosphohydrolase PLPP6 [Leptidea sinapis]|uniref:polyisoprenoid diphosphate/phosphate phosphohydrolase PLPP6 n=1 Tax=Leptidea sinapis TaxID=189913 RepID=UPI0021217457|nr:polyisoprenoid diphosphate/phosphate phosphohydrolase PLPP6 [Leptidea sinapis]